MSKPILVGYDPRHGDRAPVDFGVAVARLTGAPLVVAAVHARAPVLAVSAGQSLPYGVVDDDLLDEAPEALRDREGELRTLGVDAEVRVCRGASAASALHALAEEEDAGLLVVGSDRRSDPGRVRAGSTAGRLLHGSPCPVALVPRDWTAHAVETVGVAFVDSEEGREALRGAYAIARRVGAPAARDHGRQAAPRGRVRGGGDHARPRPPRPRGRRGRTPARRRARAAAHGRRARRGRPGRGRGADRRPGGAARRGIRAPRPAGVRLARLRPSARGAPRQRVRRGHDGRAVRGDRGAPRRPDVARRSRRTAPGAATQAAS